MGTLPDYLRDKPNLYEDVWTNHRDTLAWYEAVAADPAQLLISKRACETASPRFVQRQARVVFLATLYRLVPHLTDDLLTSELDALAHAASIARRKWIDGSGIDWAHFEADEINASKHGPLWRSLEDANQAVSGYIDAWQARHNLSDAWFGSAAYWTAAFADGLGRHGLARPQHLPLVLPDPDRYIDVHDGKERPYSTVDDSELAETGRPVFRWTPPSMAIHVPVYLDDLKYPPVTDGDGYEREDDGEFGTFDPRTLTVEEALKELLPALESRLRRALETIKAEDEQQNGAVAPLAFRKLTAFEWLVQFQIQGKSRARIARRLAEEKGKDEFSYRSHVGREIKRVADLIGLTLRDA